jgi:hypothetical protein
MIISLDFSTNIDVYHVFIIVGLMISRDDTYDFMGTDNGHVGLIYFKNACPEIQWLSYIYDNVAYHGIGYYNIFLGILMSI